MFLTDKIPGLEGNYTSNLELILSGTVEALQVAKERLLVKNKSVERQLADARKVLPRNVRHSIALSAKIKELEEKLEIQMYAELPDGTLSVPPGFWFMPDKPLLNKTKAVFLEDERYYQKAIVENLLKYKRSCVVAATGTGKSRIIRNLVLSYALAGKRVMVCVPSIELLDQTADTVDTGLLIKGLPRCGRLGDGKKPKDGAMVVLSTIQSAINWVDRFDVVIYDELHIMAAESYQMVAAGAVNAEYMHGLTATINRPDGLTPLIYAWTGKLVYSYAYSKAVADGFLSPIRYVQKQVVSKARVFKGMHSTKEYIATHSDKHFIGEVAELVKKSLESGRKTLVMFKASEPCEALAKVLGVEAANGNYRKPLYDFKAGKTELLIANTHLVSVGLDIPDISAIIFCASGTSEITFMQSIGRGTRLAPGKKDCVFLDIVADHHKYINQGKARKRMAEENLT